MGTNFYWHYGPCYHCERHDEVHVGKRSAGWSFRFRGWPHRLIDELHPEWGYDPASPFGYPVMSRADWRTVFTTTPGRLVDEYGTAVADPVAWLDELTPPDRAQITAEQVDGWVWVRDPEGFRIDKNWFS